MNEKKELYQSYVLAQVNILFDLSVPSQSIEHSDYFHKILDYLKVLYKIAPDFFSESHIERINRYKLRHEGQWASVRDHEIAPFSEALELVKRIDFQSLFSKCAKVEDVISIVISQNHENLQKQIGGNGTLLVSNRQNKRRRTPNCWQCKKGLNNYADLECSVCKWIVCSCGACGCGWAVSNPNTPMARNILKLKSDLTKTSTASGFDDAEIYEVSDTQQLIDNELSEYNNDWARSNDEGWFYSDSNDEN